MCIYVCSLYKEVCLFQGLTHEVFQSLVYWVWQHTNVAVLTFRLVVSCPALYIRKHSQPSVCMILREGKCEKVSFALLQKLVGLSVCSLSHSILLPALWLMDKHTKRFPVSYTYNILPWLRVWFQNWSWIVHGVGLSPYNLLLVEYGRELLWSLRKIWEMSFLWNDKTQIVSSVFWQNILGNIGSNGLAEHSF